MDINRADGVFELSDSEARELGVNGSTYPLEDAEELYFTLNDHMARVQAIDPSEVSIFAQRQARLAEVERRTKLISGMRSVVEGVIDPVVTDDDLRSILDDRS